MNTRKIIPFAMLSMALLSVTVYAQMTTTSVTTVPAYSPISVSLIASNASIQANQTVSFINSTTGGTGNYTTFQYYVNASSGYSINNNTMTFTLPGIYNVTETVTDTSGASGTSKPVAITVIQPAAVNNTSTGATVESDQTAILPPPPQPSI